MCPIISVPGRENSYKLGIERGGGELFSRISIDSFVAFNANDSDPPSMYSSVPTTTAIRTQFRVSFRSFAIVKSWR